MPTTNDLIGLAIDKNPVDFADAFNNLMMQKAVDAVEMRSIELAQSVYGSEAGPEEDEFEDFDTTEADDEDDADLDVEFDDDLDLDDLDLEDFTDDTNE
jgi:hypothetical protein